MGSQVYVRGRPPVYFTQSLLQPPAVQSFEPVLRTIILAAGASSRMGRPKSALPIGHAGETFLSRIISTMLAAGLPEIIVVTGAHRDATRAAAGHARDTRVQFAENAAWQSGQLSSLLTGLDAPHLVPIEAAVVTLVDVPLVSVQTVKTLVRTWRETRASVVRPARRSTRSEQTGEEHGHPVIFDRAIFDELRRADPASGAKPVVRRHAEKIVNVAIDDPGAYLDVDTPQQYVGLVT